MKKGFVLYNDQYEPIKALSQEQKGDLLDAIFQYQRDETQPENGTMVSMAFSFFKIAFDRDEDKYLKRCEKNRENARMRWDAKDATACDRMPNMPIEREREVLDREKDIKEPLPVETGNSDPLEKFDPSIVAFVQKFGSFIADKFGKSAPKKTDATLVRDCNTIRLAIKQDGFTIDEIRKAVFWAQSDSFWQDQIKSLSQIRSKGKDGTTKLQKIYDRSLAATQQPQTFSDQVKSEMTAPKKSIEELIG